MKTLTEITTDLWLDYLYKDIDRRGLTRALDLIEKIKEERKAQETTQKE